MSNITRPINFLKIEVKTAVLKLTSPDFHHHLYSSDVVLRYILHQFPGANIPCLQARTCLEIRNPCLNVRKSVLEILTMIHHYCATRCHILRQKFSKFDFGWRYAPDPAGGPHRAPHTSYLDVRPGVLLLRGGGGDGKGREGEGKREEGMDPQWQNFFV